MQRAFHRAVDQPFSGVTAQHGRRCLYRGNDRVARRGGGVHHEGFIEGVFVVVALNVDE